jgi:putative PIN family toxin of toxin-antitoxin system
VLDTNVLISSLFFGGNPRRVVDLAAAGRFQAVSSIALLAELETVLLEDFRVPAERVEEIIRDALSFCVIAPEMPDFTANVRDLGDVKVLACAVGGEADYIVTGDRDLLALGRWEDISILTPEQFLASAPLGS